MLSISIAPFLVSITIDNLPSKYYVEKNGKTIHLKVALNKETNTFSNFVFRFLTSSGTLIGYWSRQVITKFFFKHFEKLLSQERA